MIIFSGCSDFSALGLNNSTSSADNTNTQDKTSEALTNETVADSVGTDITSEESNTDQATESTSEVTQSSDTQVGK